MTIFHIEGFDVASNTTGTGSRTATVAYCKAKYSNLDVETGTDVQTDTGYGGTGKCLAWGSDASGDQHYIEFPMTQGTTHWLSFYLRPNVVPNNTNSTYILNLRETSTVHVTINLVGTAKLEARLGTFTGTILGTTANPCLWNGRWTHIKIKTIIHNTTGEVSIWADGNQVLNLTGIDTRNGGTLGQPNRVRFWGNDGQDATGDALGMMAIDNIICANSDPGNFKIVEALVPNASGSNANFTSSGGGSAVYTNVDETPKDDDTTYNHSSTTNDVDTFNAESLSLITSSIVGLQHCMDAKYVTSANNARLKLISSTVTDNGTTETLTTSYATYSKIHEVDPYTSSAWTTSGIAAMEIGYENMT